MKTALTCTLVALAVLGEAWFFRWDVHTATSPVSGGYAWAVDRLTGRIYLLGSDEAFPIKINPAP